MLFAGKVQPQYVASGGFAPQGWSAPLMAISFGLYSFLGIEMVAISSGEARSRKDVAERRASLSLRWSCLCRAMAVLVGVMPWRNAGVSESPFVTDSKRRDSRGRFIMNFVVLPPRSPARMPAFTLRRECVCLGALGLRSRRMGVLNQHGVPMGAAARLDGRNVGSILLQLRTPTLIFNP